MQVYLKNIERLKNFYQSDYYSWLETNDPKMVKNVEDALYEDPDNCDVELYKDLSLKYYLECKKCNLLVSVNKQKIKMSADIVCGVKSLKALGSSTPEFLSNYAKIRSSVKLHFIWPQHKIPTINTYRYQIYHDRIDYLLYDLKLYFMGEKTPMQKAYQNNNTKIWLNSFTDDFPKFIHEMHFEDFVNENYDVLDIEFGQRKVVTGGLQQLQSKSKNKIVQKRYMEQLLTLDKLF